MAERNFADALNVIVNGANGLRPAINTKADKNSPALTGTPTAPTADNDTDSTQIATTEFCQNLIRRLVGSAPETLNTLVELATAINNDPTFAQTIVQALDNKLNKSDAATTYLGKTATAASASKVIGGTVSLTGDVTGSGSFNSAGNVSINTTNNSSVDTTNLAKTNAANTFTQTQTISSGKLKIGNLTIESYGTTGFNITCGKARFCITDQGNVLINARPGGNGSSLTDWYCYSMVENGTWG